MTRGETVPPSQTISYAQRYEDMHLLRCFGAQPTGFYIDTGAGHPVYDNVSFAFYLRGWRGITVEPNPWLSQLSEAVRPRDPASGRWSARRRAKLHTTWWRTSMGSRPRSRATPARRTANSASARMP